MLPTDAKEAQMINDDPELVRLLRGEGDAHFRGDVRDHRTIGGMLYSAADTIESITAERDALRDALFDARLAMETVLNFSQSESNILRVAEANARAALTPKD
jgi:hypothetical protein